MEKQVPDITCLLFIDDLGFLVASRSMVEIKKLLEKPGEITLDWGTRNAITYDISKTEAILFSKARNEKLVKQLTDTQLEYRGQTIQFNQQATRWLGIWLDSRQNFSAHISERLGKAKIAESRIQRLNKTYGLPPALVRQIQVAVVQSIALYDSEI